MKRIVYEPSHGRRTARQPRRCRECHTPATHAEREQRSAATLKLDGTLHRFSEALNVYWCDDHTGIAVAP